MPRTREQLEQVVVDTEAWLDSLNPQVLAPADLTRAICAALAMPCGPSP